MPKQRVGDVDTYYEITGQGDPILFIHGLGSSTRDWEVQVDFFSPHYQVVTYDVRGHGQSDKPPGPYSVPMFAGDAAGLLRALDVAPAHVVGISMGGIIAFQLALDKPELVRSLVIVNSGPEMVTRTLRDRLAILQRLLLFRLLSMRQIGLLLSKRLFVKPEQEELRQEFVERWAQNDKRAYMEATRALVGYSVADRIGEIAHPTLVIAADEDYTPVSAKEAYVAKMQRAELVVIEDSRHASTVERPDQFNQALMAFLSRLP